MEFLTQYKLESRQIHNHRQLACILFDGRKRKWMEGEGDLEPRVWRVGDKELDELTQGEKKR